MTRLDSRSLMCRKMIQIECLKPRKTLIRNYCETNRRGEGTWKKLHHLNNSIDRPCGTITPVTDTASYGDISGIMLLKGTAIETQRH